jgi:hypothetical protein
MVRDVLSELGDHPSLEGLRRARARSLQSLDRLRDGMAGIDAPNIGLAVIGSIGRHEETEGSDLDVVALTHGTPPPSEVQETIVSEVDRIATDLQFEPSNPQGHPKFGQEFEAMEELDRTIGMDADSNTRMTLRMCLLLESEPILGEHVLIATRDRLLETYLSKNFLRDGIRPRFFMNEVMRFWRTMAVDYEGKMRDREHQGWALRNGKLRTVRKMLYISGLLPLFRCALMPRAGIAEFLHDQFSLRPADRVADAFLALEMRDEALRALGAYSTFLTILDDQEKRDALDEMKPDERDGSELWQEVRRTGVHFHHSLNSLLYDSRLGSVTREYGLL